MYNLREHKGQGEAALTCIAFAGDGCHILSTGRNQQLEKFLSGRPKPVCSLARNKDIELSGVVDYP